MQKKGDMTDRKLLEAAAKAAGVAVEFTNGAPVPFIEDAIAHAAWNPLADDGDALRLAVTLSLEIVPVEGGGIDVARWENGVQTALVTEHGIEKAAATRRAIVRAAAAISPK